MVTYKISFFFSFSFSFLPSKWDEIRQCTVYVSQLDSVEMDVSQLVHQLTMDVSMKILKQNETGFFFNFSSMLIVMAVILEFVLKLSFPADIEIAIAENKVPAVHLFF